MGWRVWRRQARQEEQLARRRTHSRPRVASAAEAALSAKVAMGPTKSIGANTGLGSARLGMSRVERSVRSVGAVGAFAPESPAALMAAARASNRTVEEVWDEALLAWLGGKEVLTMPRPAAQVVERRQRTWHEIDSTLGALRMG